ncbi:MAG: TonB-dependent receptor [Planctomycetota bacterium]|nr:TonB-dependent receptor [Planctomycetota bacterium]
MNALYRVFFRLLLVFAGVSLVLVQQPVCAQQRDPQSPSDQSPTVLPETVVQGRPAADDNPELIWSAGNLSAQGGPLLGAGRRSLRSLLDDPIHRTIVNQRELLERAPADMFQALEREVGVTVQRTQRGAASPFIRGLTGQQVLILVDGIRLNNATFRSGPNQYFNTIDPGMVDHIEVIRGPQAMLYGADAIGGVINVVTRSNRNLLGGGFFGGEWIQKFSSADLGYYGRLNVEGTIGGGSYFAGAGYGNFNDLDRGGELGRQPWTSYAQHSGDIKLSYLLAENRMLTVSLQHFAQQDLARSDRFPNRLTVFDPQQRSMGYIRYIGTEVAGPLFDRFSVTTSYHRQREASSDQRLNTSNLDIGEFDTETLGLLVMFSRDMGERGRLTYGLDLYYDDVDSFKDRFDASTGAFLSSLTPQFPDDGIYQQTGAYLQWDTELTDRLGAVSGVRFTRVSADATPIVNIDDDNNPATPDIPTPLPINPQFSDWSASAGLNYRLRDDLRLVTSFSEGFRAPNLDDLTATNNNVQQSAADIPNVNLQPERSTSYDVGVKWEQLDFRGQLFYFWTDIDDMILRAPAGTVGSNVLFSRVNHDAHVNGLEAGGDYRLDDFWTAYGNISYYHGVDKEASEPLSRIPPLQVVAGLRRRSPKTGHYIDFYAWMADRQERLNFQDLTDSRIPNDGTPGYATFNLRLGRMISDREHVSVELENLFDKDYRVHGSGVDGAGFSANIRYLRQF